MLLEICHTRSMLAMDGVLTLPSGWNGCEEWACKGYYTIQAWVILAWEGGPSQNSKNSPLLPAYIFLEFPFRDLSHFLVFLLTIRTSLTLLLVLFTLSILPFIWKPLKEFSPAYQCADWNIRNASSWKTYSFLLQQFVCETYSRASNWHWWFMIEDICTLKASTSLQFEEISCSFISCVKVRAIVLIELAVSWNFIVHVSCWTSGGLK